MKRLNQDDGSKDQEKDQDMDPVIARAMEKIVQDTIGNIPISEEIDNPQASGQTSKGRRAHKAGKAAPVAKVYRPEQDTPHTNTNPSEENTDKAESKSSSSVAKEEERVSLPDDKKSEKKVLNRGVRKAKSKIKIKETASTSSQEKPVEPAQADGKVGEKRGQASEPAQAVEESGQASEPAKTAEKDDQKAVEDSKREETPKKEKETAASSMTDADIGKTGTAEKPAESGKKESQKTENTKPEDPEERAVREAQESLAAALAATEAASSGGGPGGPGDDDDGNGGKKKSIVKRVLGILAALVVVAVIGVYGYFTYYYMDKFAPNTTINNVACGEMTASDTEALIEAAAESYEITLYFRDDISYTITGSDFSYDYVSAGYVDDILDEQNPLLWITGYFRPLTYEIEENIVYDADALDTLLIELDTMNEENMVAPVDSYYAFMNGHFEIVEEVMGTTLDADILTEALNQAVTAGLTELDVEETGAYLSPEIYSDDETLADDVEQLNAIMTASIVYELPSGDQKVLNGDTLKTWLLTDEDGNYVKDGDTIYAKCVEYVEALAEEINTVGTYRPFTTTSGLSIEVGLGDYGWEVDQDAEIEELYNNIMNNDQLYREPIYSSEEVSTENSGFGWTYIEVNLTDQCLYFYEDGEIIFQADFVSGKMTSSRYTPEGIYTLTYKETNRYLRGSNYVSYVNYWMPFNGGVGFHDASWRSTFGGTIYINSGSHGCVNMSYSDAKTLYSLIDYDIPIICFYVGGYTLY